MSEEQFDNEFLEQGQLQRLDSVQVIDEDKKKKIQQKINQQQDVVQKNIVQNFSFQFSKIQNQNLNQNIINVSDQKQFIQNQQFIDDIQQVKNSIQKNLAKFSTMQNKIDNEIKNETQKDNEIKNEKNNDNNIKDNSIQQIDNQYNNLFQKENENHEQKSLNTSNQKKDQQQNENIEDKQYQLIYNKLKENTGLLKSKKYQNIKLDEFPKIDINQENIDSKKIIDEIKIYVDKQIEKASHEIKQQISKSKSQNKNTQLLTAKSQFHTDKQAQSLKKQTISINNKKQKINKKIDNEINNIEEQTVKSILKNMDSNQGNNKINKILSKKQTQDKQSLDLSQNKNYELKKSLNVSRNLNSDKKKRKLSNENLNSHLQIIQVVINKFKKHQIITRIQFKRKTEFLLQQVILIIKFKICRIMLIILFLLKDKALLVLIFYLENKETKKENKESLKMRYSCHQFQKQIPKNKRLKKTSSFNPKIEIPPSKLSPIVKNTQNTLFSKQITQKNQISKQQSDVLNQQNKEFLIILQSLQNKPIQDTSLFSSEKDGDKNGLKGIMKVPSLFNFGSIIPSQSNNYKIQDKQIIDDIFQDSIIYD